MSEAEKYVKSVYCYSSDRETEHENMVLDIHGGSADVNKGMGGKYTYVIKVMTTTIFTLSGRYSIQFDIRTYQFFFRPSPPQGGW